MGERNRKECRAAATVRMRSTQRVLQCTGSSPACVSDIPGRLFLPHKQVSPVAGVLRHPVSPTAFRRHIALPIPQLIARVEEAKVYPLWSERGYMSMAGPLLTQGF
jgi:hypothetical protein